MNFGTNKILIEVIIKGAFGGTYFRDINFGFVVNGTENRGKSFMT